jgi:dTDP-4-dehydrorhamnose 3,5-epimerase
MMEFEPTSIPGVMVIQPRVFADGRGFFLETWQAKSFAAAGIPDAFVQDNHSHSRRHTLRGLHYQIQHAQGKLVRVVAGCVFDVVVDIRRSSSTFGRIVTAVLSADNHKMLWVPPGFAHGFLALTETVDFLYRCTDYYSPSHERTILWNDPALGIKWPLPSSSNPVLSDKDQKGLLLRDAECYP